MTKKTSNRFSPEVRERAVRMVLEHGGDHTSQWAAMSSIASKIGCTGETLRKWVRQAERDQGKRPGLTSDERERMKTLERENRELRQANEILRKASAYFAQAELDGRSDASPGVEEQDSLSAGFDLGGKVGNGCFGEEV
jgi:transposase